MGQLILSNAVQALNDGGIPAERGYPAGKLRIISEPVCAVSLQSADVRTKKVTLLATVLCPAELGAPLCEETALEAGELLATQGGKCSVGACRFDGRTGLFYVEVTAEFALETPKITIGETKLTHVLAFTSWRTLDEEVTDWLNTKWNFRLEEYFPLGDSEDANPVDSFMLTHTSENGTETYSGCTWTYQRRVWDASGIKQIRLGVADEMETA